MLKITPYLGLIVIIVSLGGIFYPKLGYFLLLVFATLMIIAPFRGRWFCGNLCPRGSFVDFWLGPLSRKLPIPSNPAEHVDQSPHLHLPHGIYGLQNCANPRSCGQSGHGLCNYMPSYHSGCHSLWNYHCPQSLVFILSHGHDAEGGRQGTDTSSKWIKRDASTAENARRSVPCSFL